MNFLRGVMVGCVALASCAGPSEQPPQTYQSFEHRLMQVSALFNAKRFDEVATHFTPDAEVQSPITPRMTPVGQFLTAAAADHFQMNFAGTETIYSLPGSAKTRSLVTAVAPGRFRLTERVGIDWKFDRNHWRIARIEFSDWPTILGNWKKSGLRGEGAIELRVYPGGAYAVYAGNDRTLPMFRGKFTVEGNKITFEDNYANDPSDLQRGLGSYLFVRTQTGMTLQVVEEDNTWRAQRFAGEWTASR